MHEGLWYFAHSLLDYDSEKETRAYEVLVNRFPGLLCPNRDLRYRGMDKCYRIIRHSAGVVVLPRNGYIGRGVYMEILEALSFGKMVYALSYEPEPMLTRVVTVELHDPTDWKRNYGTLILHEKSKENLDAY